MKNKALMLLGLLSTVTLTSCRITLLKSETVNSSLYSLFKGEVTTKDISYEILEGKELLPYFTVSSYISLYDDFLKDEYQITVNDNVGEQTVYVTNEADQNVFVASISDTYKIVYEDGDFSDAFTFSKDYSKSSLYVACDSDYDIVIEPTSIRDFSYSNMGFSTFRKNGKTYYPLSLLECIFSSYSGVYHLFNYNRILQYSEYEELTDTTYKVNGEDYTAFKEMKAYIKDNLEVMPLYLREDRKASFLFTLENQYGLKYTRNISSMKAYLEKQDFFADFLSEDTLKRNEAFYKTFELLDDGHTSIKDHNDFAWREGEFNAYGPHVTRILQVRQFLSTQRTLAPGDVYYSTDEKLAFFTFDSFTFIENAYQSDGKTLKSGLSDYHSEDYDSFFYAVKCLNEIKEKGGVEDVIIDISTNGGGAVGIMMELVTLLSSNNSSDIYLQKDTSKLAQKITTKVDSNLDGFYNNNDTFGNDFHFHILTSEFSFSCGNAFPFYLKKNHIASIIGQKSGGGECAVGEAYLPSGEHYYHSSSLHIGWVEEGVFEGDEPGVEVDKEIAYEDFYNLDKLQTLIK